MLCAGSADLGNLLASLEALLYFLDDAHEVRARARGCLEQVGAGGEHELHDLGLRLFLGREGAEVLDTIGTFEELAVEASTFEVQLLDLDDLLFPCPKATA